ncbi:MAG: hypothetical protein K2M73_11225 [Lachnospiraceae bacterium]|nr:hypothetical protein [Lachnospiraceae bacterium]
MSVNGIQSNAYGSYATESYSKSTTGTKTTEAATGKEEKAAVYESTANKMTEKDRAALVQKLKADTNNRVNQLQSLVKNMFLKQGQKVKNNDDIWSMLASGDFTVDPATAAKAKAEIADDGYWGVDQTSERIFEMAKALSGGDSDKMDKMLEAFKKGYDQATKAWGRTLPDISSRTYDAVIEKFDNYKTES